MKRLAGFMQTYWTRGEAGRATPQSATVLMLRWWVVAFAFKVLGASWDVAWHFKWLRDDFAPPHIVNTIGTGIAIVLVLVHTFTGYGADRKSLRIIQTGTIIFVIAGPLDIINHRLNGLDITSWSPSHMLLYIGTGVMIAGVIRNWWVNYPREGRWAWQFTAGLTVLGAYLFENTFFPNMHQEYGIVGIQALFGDKPYASEELIEFAAAQFHLDLTDPVQRTQTIVQFALPIPSWLYPVWGVVLAGLVLVVMRILIGRRFAATIMATGYVVYRTIIWPLLHYTIWPPSSVPFWLVALGIGVDLAFLVRGHLVIRAVAGAVVTTAAAYGGLFAQTVLEGTPTNLWSLSFDQMHDAWLAGAPLHTPPAAWWSAAIAAPLLAALWFGVAVIAKRTVGLDAPRPPELTVTYAAEPIRDADGYLAGFAGAEADRAQTRR